MDPSSVQHNQQEMATQTLESMLVSTKGQQDNQKKPRPQPEQALKCPRCDSTNTKFCYYNNYSLSQPRYFCKSCRRYWTKGGTLRNVPVGGGCRKSKRSSSSNSRRTTQDHQLITTTNPNPLIPSLPPLTYDHSTSDHHRLGIAFARLHKQLPNAQLGFDHDHEPSMLGNPSGHFHSTPSCFDALKSGFLDSPHGFSNLYYGMGNGNLGGGGVENGGGEEVGMPYEEVSVVTMKQEMCNGREGDNRVLWGFPWQLGGGGGGGGGVGNENLGGGGGGDLDSGRESCWNGIGSSWHGLLNSPLM